MSCSKSGKDDSNEESRGVVNVVGSSAKSGATGTTRIPVELGPAFSTSFSLYQSATAYTIQLTDCLSGYTATVTEANLDGLEVFKFDRGCLARLTQFTFNGRTYVPTAGDPYSTWQPGDVARFDEVGEPGIEPLYVIVVTTLGNPITGTEVVKYGLADVAEGNARSILLSTVGASAKITSGLNVPPSFTIRSIEFVGHDLVTAAGKFKFVLECTASIGVTNTCSSVDFTDIDYKLVKDIYSDTPNQSDCDTIFATAGTPITLPADRVATGASGTAYGGFETVTLTGPGELLSNPNLILALRSYGASYQYFNVDTKLSVIFPDTAAPSITRTNSAHANGSFTVGENIDIDITFGEPVTLTGTASNLSLSGGGTATYLSKPAAATLRYRYIVLAAQDTSDLDVTAFNLSSDSIEDAAGNSATLTLPAGVNSLAGSSAIVVETVNPNLTSISTAHANGAFTIGEVIDIDLNFDEPVTITGTSSTLSLSHGGSAVYHSKPSANTIRYRYTVVAAQNSADLDVSTFNINTDTITDIATNVAVMTLPSGLNSLAGSAAIVIDTTAPTVTSVSTSHGDGTFSISEVIDIDVTFSDPVTLTGSASTLALNSGGAAVFQSQPSSTVLRYRYTVAASENHPDLDVDTLSLNGDVIVDVASNNADLTLPSGGSSLAGGAAIAIDTLGPTVTNITSTTPDGTYKAGQVISIQLTYSEAVTLAGTGPGITLDLETGVTDRLAVYASGSGTTTLTFNYTVVAGDTSADLTTHAAAPQLALTGTSPTLRDSGDNAASLTVAGTTLATNKNLVIDTTSPPALTTFSGLACCTVNPLKANAVQVRTTFPATVSDYSSVVIRRATGATAPADCTSDTLVTTLNGPFTGSATTYYTDDTGVAGGTFSYRACVYDVAGNETSSNTFSSAPSAKFSWIFATSSNSHTGNLGGVSGADAICTAAGAAIDATLGWSAVLSTSSMNASGRVPIRGSVYNYAPTPVAVATSYATMWGSAWAAAVTYDESGASVTGSAWSGSTGAGAVDRGTGVDALNNYCADWTSNAGGTNGRYGNVVGTAAAWVNSATQACSGTARLYCVSKTIEPLVAFSATTGTVTAGNIDVTVTFPATTTSYSKVEIRRKLGNVAPSTACTTDILVKTYNGPTFTSETFTDPTATNAGAYFSYIACLFDSVGRVATTATMPARAFRTTPAHGIFITTTGYSGNLGGLAGGDAICQLAGNKFDPTKTWQFVASDSTTDAITRLVITGPVRNVNGVLLANSEADFFDGTIAATISLTEAGVASTNRSWTGSQDTGIKYGSGLYCTDWTDGTAGVSGRRGRHSTTNTQFDNSTSTCATLNRLYCISSTAY